MYFMEMFDVDMVEATVFTSVCFEGLSVIEHREIINVHSLEGSCWPFPRMQRHFGGQRLKSYKHNVQLLTAHSISPCNVQSRFLHAKLRGMVFTLHTHLCSQCTPCRLLNTDKAVLTKRQRSSVPLLEFIVIC